MAARDERNTQASANIDALLKETRRFPLSPEFRAKSVVKDPGVYDRAAADPVAFWEGFARELTWMKPWDTALDWNPQQARWFVGGQLNVTVNCLDRHIESG